MEKKLHATAANETDWRNKLTKTRIGSVTLPVYLVTASIILVTALLEQLPVNMLGGFAVILTMGWLLGTIGGNIPISTINYGLFQFTQPKCLRLNKYFNETSKLSLFLYCLFSLWKYPWNEPQNFSPRFNAHDCPDGIRNDFSNGCWDPCCNAVRSRLET